MKAATLGLLAALLVGCSPTRSETPDEKTCSDGTAKSLTNFSAMSGSSIESHGIAKEEAAKVLIANFSDTLDAMNGLNEKLRFLDATKREKLTRMVRSGAYLDAENLLRSIVAEEISKSIESTAKGSVAGRQVSFKFVCVWDSTSKPLIYPASR